ncbi:MAG: CRISPR system precrRNA processing endoribonuclease RAMP protein Cas6 [Tissierellia bacterium]|nr:CRISPR system precrRNA processing endoribonuclease RAMP protein Cas6 [Tissierellia bacterium]
MKQVDSEAAEGLHSLSINPYSQSLRKINNETVWEINTLNDYAYQKIILPLLSKDRFFIDHYKTEYLVKNRNLSQVDLDQLVKMNLSGSDTSIFTIAFQTPTSFKSDGKYVNMPSLRFIYQSLIMKFDASSNNLQMMSDDILNQLINHSTIVDYRLRSARFFLEKSSIPSFMGEMTIKVYGTKQLKGIVNLLLNFGVYSGMGIKASLGMGSMQLK